MDSSFGRIRPILDFWFTPETKAKWFAPDAAFDGEIRHRFLADMDAAAQGALDHWAALPDGALALILLLDQFPRNVYRNTPRAFATDDKAREIAELALARQFDAGMDKDDRLFFYLPFEHSENLDDQNRAVGLFEQGGDDPEGLDFAIRHRDIIERFGRFPHRNAILGRESTPKEAEFLKQPGSGF